jgi:hypothetical protein
LNAAPVSAPHDDVEGQGHSDRERRETKAQGKHDVLMQVKTADASRFIAVPLGNS